MDRLRARLKEIYEGDTAAAHRFRYGLVAFDLTTVVFIVVTSFAAPSPIIERLDLVFGIAIAADLIARLSISDRLWRDLLSPFTWADLVAMLSFLAPIAGEGVGFLRVLRTLRLLRMYRVLARLRQDSRLFRVNEEVVLALRGNASLYRRGRDVRARFHREFVHVLFSRAARAFLQHD